MSILLPLDDNGNPISIMGFAPNGTQKLSTELHNLSSQIHSSVEWVTLVSTGIAHFAVGGEAIRAHVDRSPVLFPGVYVDVPLKRSDRFVAVTAESPCVVYVMERE